MVTVIILRGFPGPPNDGFEDLRLKSCRWLQKLLNEPPKTSTSKSEKKRDVHTDNSKRSGLESVSEALTLEVDFALGLVRHLGYK
jgi:hypothetical protein